MKKFAAILAVIVAPLAVAAPAMAQNAPPDPWAQISATSAMLGIGGSSGEGQLTLSNLGTNCIVPFTVSGFGAGIQVGVSKISAAGPVKNMTRYEDFPGTYSAASGEATIIAGGGGTTMKNNANNVTLTLTSQTTGLNIGIAGQGMTVAMPVPPPPSAPRSYVLEFGFNKDWLNRAHHAMLDQIAAAWKCRFVHIKVVGRSDSVGKEDANLELASRRAAAVRDYLIGTGIYGPRIQTLTSGEINQQVPTQQGVRLRANRVVVVTIE